jgi:hypothetical protein
MGIFKWRGRVSRKDFRRRFIEAMSLAAPQVRCTESTEDDLDFAIADIGDYQDIKVSLHRAYKEFEAAPEDFDEIFDSWYRSIRRLWQPPEPLNTANIVPMIKDRAWLGASRQPGEVIPERLSPDSMCYDDYNEELIVVYAVHADGFSYPSRADLLAEGVNPDEIRALALTNLRARTPERSIQRLGTAWSIAVGGNFEASLLVDEPLWSHEPFADAAELLVAVPERDFLVASTDTSVAAVWHLASVASHGERTRPYPISAQLLVRGPERFELLDAAVNDEHHPIPALDVIDIEAERAGVRRYVIVVAEPLAGDPRSVFRLYRKLDGYLRDIAATRPPVRTEIEVNIHAGSDPAYFPLLALQSEYVASRGATLIVERSS